MTRRVLEAVVGLLVLVVAIAWLSGLFEDRIEPGEVSVAEPTLADAELVAVEEVREPAFEWASGEVASARHTAIASRVLARIDEITVRAGSSVAEGDVLVKLDARDLRAQVSEAEEALRSVAARLELARRESDRAGELFRTGVAPQSRVDETTSRLRELSADLAGRKDALEQMRTAASFAELRSPVRGRVVDRLAEPGDTAVPGRPILRIYDPALLRVEAPVRETLAVKLSVGDELRVDVPALGTAVEGRIDEIVPFAERGARTLLIKVGLPRTEAHLFAGMFARVAVPAGERRRLLVPAAAVVRVGQLEFVSVVTEGGAIERRLVTTGELADAGRVEILSGIEAGERVRAPAGTGVPGTAAPGRPVDGAAAAPPPESPQKPLG